MIVGDASVVVAMLANEKPAGRLWTRVAEHDLHAPALIDLEVLNALRRGLARGELALGRATGALKALDDLAIKRYRHEPLLRRVWELRENLTAYDASYVALAEALQAPLLTTDAAMASAPRLQCEVELFQ